MSNLLKIKRLVDGDDLFKWRVEAACWAEGMEFSDELLRFVASRPEVLEQAELSDPDTIDSSSVTDETLLEAAREFGER